MRAFRQHGEHPTIFGDRFGHDIARKQDTVRQFALVRARGPEQNERSGGGFGFENRHHTIPLGDGTVQMRDCLRPQVQIALGDLVGGDMRRFRRCGGQLGHDHSAASGAIRKILLQNGFETKFGQLRHEPVHVAAPHKVRFRRHDGTAERRHRRNHHHDDAGRRKHAFQTFVHPVFEKLERIVHQHNVEFGGFTPFDGPHLDRHHALFAIGGHDLNPFETGMIVLDRMLEQVETGHRADLDRLGARHPCHDAVECGGDQAIAARDMRPGVERLHRLTAEQHFGFWRGIVVRDLRQDVVQGRRQTQDQRDQTDEVGAFFEQRLTDQVGIRQVAVLGDMPLAMRRALPCKVQTGENVDQAALDAFLWAAHLVKTVLAHDFAERAPHGLLRRGIQQKKGVVVRLLGRECRIQGRFDDVGRNDTRLRQDRARFDMECLPREIDLRNDLRRAQAQAFNLDNDLPRRTEADHVGMDRLIAPTAQVDAPRHEFDARCMNLNASHAHRQKRLTGIREIGVRRDRDEAMQKAIELGRIETVDCRVRRDGQPLAQNHVDVVAIPAGMLQALKIRPVIKPDAFGILIDPVRDILIRRNLARRIQRGCDRRLAVHDEARAHVLAERVFRQPGARHDADRAGVGIGLGLDFDSGRGRQNDRREQVHVVDFDGLTLGLDAGGGIGHFGKGGARQKHAVAHLVIGQRGEQVVVQIAAPDTGFTGERRTQKRVMFAIGAKKLAQFLTVGGAQLLVLEGIARQADQRTRRRRERRVLFRANACKNGAQGGTCHWVRRFRVVLGQRMHDGAVACVVVERVGDVVRQNRLCAHFEEGRVSGIARGFHRRLELHRLADVGPPVVGGQVGAIHQRAGRGREHRHAAFRRHDIRQAFLQLGFRGLKDGAVERVVDVEHHAGLAMRALGPFGERLERFGGACERDAARRVDRRELDIGIAEFVEQRTGLFGAGLQRRHRAGASELQLRPTAAHRQMRGLLQRQSARGPGGSDFAAGMTDDRRRNDAALGECDGLGDLVGDDEALNDAAVAPFLRQRLGVHLVDDRPAHHLGEQRVEFLIGCAVVRILAERQAAHAEVLRAIAGIDEDRRFVALAAFVGDEPRVFLSRRIGAEGLGGLSTVLGQNAKAFGMQAALVPRLFGKRAGVQRRRRLHPVGIGGREVFERPVAEGRRDEDAVRAGGGRRGRGLGRGHAFEDHVTVHAPETEGADAAEQRTVAKIDTVAREHEFLFVEVDMRVQVLGVERAWQTPILHRDERLEHPDHAGRGFEVADVGFGRPDGQRRFAVLGHGAAEGVGLDRVTDERSGAVRLDEGQIVGGDRLTVVKPGQQFVLPLFRRKRHVHRIAVGVRLGIHDARLGGHRNIRRIL